MATAETDHQQILEFVQLCRTNTPSRTPVSFQIVSASVREHTGLTMYWVRVAVAQLLNDGHLTN